MRTALTLASLAVLGLVLTFWTLLGLKNDRERGAPRAETQQTATAAPSRAGHQVLTSSALIAPSVREQHASQLEPAVEPELSDEPLDQRTPEEVLFEFEQHFAADGPAIPPSRELGQSLQDVLQELETPGVFVQSIDCKSSTCRVLVEFDDEDADQSAFREILSAADSPFGRYGFTVPKREEREDGSIVATIYVSLH